MKTSLYIHWNMDTDSKARTIKVNADTTTISFVPCPAILGGRRLSFQDTAKYEKRPNIKTSQASKAIVGA